MQVRDPVCGMVFAESEAKGRSDYEGSFYFFCSEACKAAFDKDPERYVSGATGAAH